MPSIGFIQIEVPGLVLTGARDLADAQHLLVLASPAYEWAMDLDDATGLARASARIGPDLERDPPPVGTVYRRKDNEGELTVFGCKKCSDCEPTEPTWSRR
jgi:hypothetical protein